MWGAQLVERLLPTPENRSSNLDVGKILSTNCTVKNKKDENKEKEAGNGPPLKKQAGKFRTETSQKFCSGKPKTLQPFFCFSSSMALHRVRGKLRVAK